MRILRSAAALLVVGAGAALTSSCTWNDTRGTDSDRVFPTARVLFRLDEPAPAGERRRRFRHGFEAELSGTAGEFDLADVGETDYSVVHGSLAYRFGVELSRAEIMGLTGLATDRVELSGNPMVDTEESYFGPMFGIETRLRVRDWLRPYGRLTWFLMERGSYANQAEVGVVFPIVDEFELFAAYRHWRGEYGDAAPMERDLDARWRGVAIGFGLRL